MPEPHLRDQRYPEKGRVIPSYAGGRPPGRAAGATTMITQLPKNIPGTPGVYFFSAKGGSASGGRNTVVYIGKAKHLRNRLRGHPMLKKSDRLDWQEVSSEIEALILESQLIKKHKPKYNIDYPSYVYVAITAEDFPKILVTRQDGIGPFTNATELRSALKVLRKLFPYCTCKQKHNRLCLNAHIGKCLGFCCLKTGGTKEEKKKYQAMIHTIRDVLSGKREVLFRQFPNVFANTKVIREIAGRESAVVKLEKIFKLKKIKRIEGYDISNIQGTHATGSMVVFENGYPNKQEYRKFKINAPASPDDTRMLGEMLTRRFNHPEWPEPDLLLIDGGIAQINVAKKFFRPVISIAKGKQEVFSNTLEKPVAINTLPKATQNLILHIDSEAHRFAISYYRKLHKKTVSGTIKKHD